MAATKAAAARHRPSAAPTIAARLYYADLVHRANIDDDVKVLVIRGAGKHLGGGADLPEQAAMLVIEALPCKGCHDVYRDEKKI